MADQKPSVRRMVSYTSHGSPDGTYKPEDRAAIITELGAFNDAGISPDGKTLPVGLCILNPSGMFFQRDVPYSEHPQPGHWSWPPRT